MSNNHHTLRKTIFWLLGSIFIVLVLFLGWQYYRYRNSTEDNPTFLVPRIESAKFTITELNREKSLMYAEIVLRNSIPLSFTVDSLQYTLSISGVPVMHSTTRRSFRLHANDTAILHLPMTIMVHDLDSVLRTDAKQKMDSVDYTIKTTFYTDLSFKRQFGMSITKHWPLFHYPEIKVDHMEIDSFSLRRARISLYVDVTNNNVFPIRLKDIHYKLGIEKKHWMEGFKPGITELLPNRTVRLVFPARISLGEVARTTLKLITKGKMVHYAMQTTFHLEADNSMLHDSKVTLEGAGTVQSLLDFTGN